MGYGHHGAYFLQRDIIDIAEVITPWGFCYTFNVVEQTDLFNVDKTANVFDSQRPHQMQEFLIGKIRQSKPSNNSYPWESPNYRLCFHAIFHKLITSFQSCFILKLMNP